MLMFDFDPETRITIQDCLRHPFLKMYYEEEPVPIFNDYEAAIAASLVDMESSTKEQAKKDDAQEDCMTLEVAEITRPHTEEQSMTLETVDVARPPPDPFAILESVDVVRPCANVTLESMDLTTTGAKKPCLGLKIADTEADKNETLEKSASAQADSVDSSVGDEIESVKSKPSFTKSLEIKEGVNKQGQNNDAFSDDVRSDSTVPIETVVDHDSPKTDKPEDNTVLVIISSADEVSEQVSKAKSQPSPDSSNSGALQDENNVMFVLPSNDESNKVEDSQNESQQVMIVLSDCYTSEASEKNKSGANADSVQVSLPDANISETSESKTDVAEPQGSGDVSLILPPIDSGDKKEQAIMENVGVSGQGVSELVPAKGNRSRQGASKTSSAARSSSRKVTPVASNRPRNLCAGDVCPTCGQCIPENFSSANTVMPTKRPKEPAANVEGPKQPGASSACLGEDNCSTDEEDSYSDSMDYTDSELGSISSDSSGMDYLDAVENGAKSRAGETEASRLSGATARCDEPQPPLLPGLDSKLANSLEVHAAIDSPSPDQTVNTR